MLTKTGRARITLLPTTPKAKKSFSPKYTPYLVRATQHLGQVGNLPKGKILVVLGGDFGIKRLKKIFFKKEAISDVISFNYPETSDPSIEIFINTQQAKRQKPRRWPMEKEILFLYIHGILHCLGWDDKKARQRKKMLELGQRILDKTWTDPN